ncbi:S-layer homology domain-containing protein [Paenibacillus sp. SYP-B4298]|uniref:S-layer homology domain-containing protein n=1 Tax=Paenibacillus sp. SYP-B4298 TaxID=2996034 RepID=UPI0022DCE61B|nr:S-layer homology domain-containing protein [Paenibacillus sp. SYP-B4298]
MSRSKRRRKQWLVTLATVIALTGTIPSAAFADRIATTATVSTEHNVAEPSSESPVNAKITKEKADELSRKIVSIPKEYTLQNANYQTSALYSGKQGSWSMSYVLRKNNKSLGTINTRINADTGELIYYTNYNNDPTRKPSYPPKADREQAQEIASSFIGVVGSSYKGQIKVDEDFGVDTRQPLTGEVSYSFRYNRLVGGLPFMDNYIQVMVDGEGHIINYELNWDATVKFENAAPKLTSEQAMARFREEAKLQLSYMLPYSAKKQVPILSYNLSTMVLDAVTGKPIERSGRYVENTTKPVADKALGAKPTAGKALTAEQASQKVAAAFDLPSTAKLEDSSYSEYMDDASGKSVSVWGLNWSVKQEGKDIGYSAWAEVNALTGEVRSFSYYDGRENKDQKDKAVTYEQAKSKALEIVKKQLPGYVQELYLQEEADLSQYTTKKPEEIGSYSFRFPRYVNGVNVPYDNVYVRINAVTGSVQDYNAQFFNYTYPSTLPTLIDKDKALDEYNKYYKVELTYALLGDDSYIGIPVEKYNLMVAAGEINPNDASGSGPAKLVYRMVKRPLEENVFLDAQTGQWRAVDSGEVTSLIKQKAADIAGHWAERELQLMIDYKALDLEDGKVRPNQTVTRGELIKMLVLSMNGGSRNMPMAALSMGQASFKDVAADSSYFVYIEEALANDLIDKGDGSFNPEGKVDREEMAELIVRALGYNTLADHTDIFNVNFADASKMEKKGQAAIVTGLGIMSKDSKGNFRPSSEVSRAEASAAFFRFLQAKADLKEAPLRD